MNTLLVEITMGKQTNIAWCDKTFNPWVGCTKVSPACDNCYAENWAKRAGDVTWGAERRRTSVANWKLPLKWDREAKEKGIRYKVFCASLADVFDNKVPVSWRMDLFELIAQTTNIDWLILTKRIGNVQGMASGDGQMFNVIFNKVWLGITICNQEEADRDIPKLIDIPAKLRFLSIEPMLTPVDLKFMSRSFGFPEHISYDDVCYGMRQGIHWVIVGGETGANARPLYPHWVWSIKEQCRKANIPFFFKQWGEYLSQSQDLEKVINTKQHSFAGIVGIDTVYRVGKAKAGHLLDGKEYYQFPE